MPFQIIGVNLAAQPGVGRRISSHHSRAAQSVKTFRVRLAMALENSPHHLEKSAVLNQRYQDAAQMVSKEALVAIGLSREGVEGNVLRRQFVEPAPHQERLSIDEVGKAREL